MLLPMVRSIYLPQINSEFASDLTDLALDLRGAIEPSFKHGKQNNRIKKSSRKLLSLENF